MLEKLVLLEMGILLIAHKEQHDKNPIDVVTIYHDLSWYCSKVHRSMFKLSENIEKVYHSA